MIAGFVGAGVYALWRGSTPLLRVLGAVVLFTTLAYLFTPLTAAGEEGQPIAFEWNVRYVAPAAAVGLAMLPVLVAADGDRRRRDAVLAFLSVLAAATVGSLVQWQQGHVKGAIAAGDRRPRGVRRSSPGFASAGCSGPAPRGPRSPASRRSSRSAPCSPATSSSATTSSAATTTSARS